MIYSASPLEPSGPSPIAASAQWVEAVLLGEIAVILAVIAVAVVGLLFLTGRLAARRAAQVVLGCALVFGAPAIASGLLMSGDRTPAALPAAIAPESASAVRQDLPRGGYNPYAGAALRDDR